MRVMLAVHHFPPHYTGGAELRAYRTAHQLQSLGHEVRVVCVGSIDAGDSQGLSYLNEVYKSVPLRRLSFNLSEAPDPFRWSYDNPWIGNHLRRYLAEWKPDIFHLISGYLMSASAIEVANALAIPVVATLTDYWFLCPRITLLRSNGQICVSATPVDCARCLAEESRRFRWPSQITPILADHFWQSAGAEVGRKMGIEPGSKLGPPRPMDHLARLAGASERVKSIYQRRARLAQALASIDLAICPSNFLRQRYIEAGADPKRLIFCRQGLDLKEPVSRATATKTKSSHLHLGYMGQLAPHKGVHILIDAVRRLDDENLELAIYGDLNKFPQYTARLRQTANGDPRIQFAGRYQRTELARVFSETDVVVVPSVWYENSPNTILEAFAHNTPVVASELGGMAELVESGRNGLLFEMGNPADLAYQLKRLIQDPELTQRLQTGIKPVKTVEEEALELVEIYRRMVTRHPASVQTGQPTTDQEL